jgi:hypothetical protein
MKVWKTYYLENTGSWEIFSDSESETLEADGLSREGRPATMCMVRKAGRFVSVTILPRAHEFDSVTGRIGDDQLFHVVIECLVDGWRYLSSGTALKIWKMKKLGDQGFRIERD